MRAREKNQIYDMNKYSNEYANTQAKFNIL